MCHILPIAMLLTATFAEAASFDCKKAVAPVEGLVCAARDLSSLDDVLSDIYALEVAQVEDASLLQASQRKWLLARNACVDSSCIKRQYEKRIAELSCSSKRMTGSAIGSNQCSHFTTRVVEVELSLMEERYGRKISEESNNPEYTKSTLVAEHKAWRDYRSAQCALYGATEGGSDGWKNAFASMCELDETKKRLARIKKELNVK